MSETQIAPMLKAKGFTQDYAIMAVSLLQRNPIVMKPLTEMELEYAKYRKVLEEERSRGVFHIPTARDESAKPKSIDSDPTQLFPEQVNLNENLEVTNLKRLLHRKLYFSIRDPLTGSWHLPTAQFTESPEETALHVKAQQALAQVLEPSTGLQFYHVGAAPVAYHSEHFEDRKVAPFGAKHFFFRSQLLAGTIRLRPEFREFGWFSREELKDRLNASLYASIKPVLLE